MLTVIRHHSFCEDGRFWLYGVYTKASIKRHYFVWVICLDFGPSPDPHAYERREGSSVPTPLSRLIRVFVALQCQKYQYLDVLMLRFRNMLTY